MRTQSLRVLVLLAAAAGFVHPAVAQVSDTDSDDAGLKHNVRWHPVKLVDPVLPGAELSLERFLTPRWSMQVSGAWLNPGLLPFFDALSGYRVLISAKRFTIGAARHTRFYFGPEAGWSESRITTGISVYSPSDTDAQGNVLNYYDDAIRTYRRIQFYSARFGVQVAYKRFVLDAAIGCGVKVRTVVHLDRDYPGLQTTPRHSNILSPATVEARRRVSPNFPATISIGYRF